MVDKGCSPSYASNGYMAHTGMDKTMNIYEKHGYESRQDYLETLSEETGVRLDIVLMMAEMLGPSEDFDGLVAMIEDAGE